MDYKTEQEEFWATEFGDEYIDRNKSSQIFSSRIALWTQVLKSTKKINSFVEFGCNVGPNLKSIKSLLPKSELTGIEINKKACDLMSKWGKAKIINQSILEYNTKDRYDMTIISGVLIHIDPNELNAVYEKLYKNSNKYIFIFEYYNPTPVTINYRGHSDKLFKRDFAGEMLDKYCDLKLIDYEFIYHRDNYFPQDDGTWFLLEKQ